MELALSFLPLVLLVIMAYFMIIRPEKKRKEDYDAMLRSLEVNDEIVTKGGIVGKIIKIGENDMILESGPDRVRFRVLRDAVYLNQTKAALKAETSATK